MLEFLGYDHVPGKFGIEKRVSNQSTSVHWRGGISSKSVKVEK